MRPNDIVIGEYYNLKRLSKNCPGNANPYAKAIEVIKPNTLISGKKFTHYVVKCEWTVNRNDLFGFIKYFKPVDLVKAPTMSEKKEQ